MNDPEHAQQEPAVDPDSLIRLAECLRASFTADNHDSLSGDITRLLLHLSREAKPPPGG
jgi:hypothetical protein